MRVVQAPSVSLYKSESVPADVFMPKSISISIHVSELVLSRSWPFTATVVVVVFVLAVTVTVTVGRVSSSVTVWSYG